MDINIDYKKLYDLYKDELIFITFNIEDYNNFSNNTNTNIKYYIPLSLEELVIIINSCKLFIGGLSAPLALHKKSIIDYPIAYPNSLNSRHYINLQKTTVY